MFRFYDLIHYVNLQILYIYFSRKFKLLQFIYFDSNFELLVSSIQIFFLTPEITRYVTKFEEKKLRENFRSINRPNRFIDLADGNHLKIGRKDGTSNHLRNSKQWRLLFTPWWNEENGEAWMHFSRHIGHRIITPCTEPRKFAASCDLLPP